jgi:hypothetical protein
MAKKKRDMAEIEQRAEALREELSQRPVTMPKSQFNERRAILGVLDWCTGREPHRVLDHAGPAEHKPPAA